MIIKKPKYSVCICNYNMAITLDLSLKSVINQLNDDYEVVVIDDGSNDNSLEILREIKNNFYNFRYIPLIRERARKLGETRNISIKAARGEYVILHLDTDDIWEKYIKSFVTVYHEIEKRLNINNFLLSGKQIQMANRELLLMNKYRNIYYGEDRMLWNDLALQGKYYALDHKVFRKRIPLSSKKFRIIKVFKSQISSMVISFEYLSSTTFVLKGFLRRIFFKSDWSLIISFFNLLILFPIFFYTILFKRRKITNLHAFNYRELNLLDLKKIESNTMMEFGEFPLSSDERKIFFNNS